MEARRIGVLLLAALAGCGAKSALQVEPPPPVDGGPRDGGPVDLGPDLTGCVPTGPETCDGFDEDCDGRIDEGLPLRPVGESVVFRDTGEGETGGCTTCGWVRDFTVQSTAGGMLAFWHLGFDGSDPQPNAYLRMLDDGGGPRGPIQRLDGLLNGGWTTSTPHPDGVLVTYCGRVGGGDDVAVRALLSPVGEPLWEVRASPRDRSCGAWRPVSVAVGRSRIFTAWTDNSSGPVPGHEVLVDVAGGDGESRDWEQVLPEGDGKPGLAVGAERVVHVQSAREEPRVSTLHIQTYGLDGASDERALITALAEESFYGEPWVFPTPSGFTVHMKEQSRDPGGRIVLRLDPLGVVVDPPRREDTGLQLINAIDDAIQFQGGVLLATPVRTPDGEFGYRVFVTDERGVTVDQWNPRDYDEGFGDGAFVVRRGELFLAYRRGVESPDGRSLVQLRIWPLACEP